MASSSKAAQAQKRQGKDAAEAREQQAPSPWEWVAGLVGFVLVAGTIGYMVWHGLTVPETPARISVEARSVEPYDEKWLVTFRAVNRGNATAAGVQIEGVLKDGELAVETTEATLDYVPANSAREGGLVFTKDPGQYRLELNPKGYQKP